MALVLPILKFASETKAEFTERKIQRSDDTQLSNNPPQSQAVHITWNSETEAIVKKVYQARIRSVYQLSYGKKESKNSGSIGDLTEESLKYFSHIFGDKTGPVLVPPECSKKVFGSRNPSRYYLELSTYQDEISRLGYKRLRAGQQHIRNENDSALAK